MRLGVSLATIGVAVSVLVMAVFAPLRARPRLGARRAARRGHLADRRRGGVLGAAPGAAAAPAHRRARGRVRAQRRPDRRAGHAGQRRRPTTGSLGVRRRSIAYELVARHRSAASVVGFGGAWLLRRVGAAVARVSTRWRCSPSRCSRTPARRLLHGVRLRRGVRRRADPRQRRAAAPRPRPGRSPRGSPGSPRSGCS